MSDGEGWGLAVGKGDPCALANVCELICGGSTRDGVGLRGCRDINTNSISGRNSGVAAPGVDLWAGDLSELLSSVSVGGDLLVEVTFETSCNIRRNLLVETVGAPPGGVVSSTSFKIWRTTTIGIIHTIFLVVKFIQQSILGLISGRESILP